MQFREAMLLSDGDADLRHINVEGVNLMLENQSTNLKDNNTFCVRALCAF